MIVSRALHENEPDLLIGFEHKILIVKDCAGKVCNEQAAPKPNGWTHEKLENIDYSKYSNCWDAYIGNQWIGSSEL